MEPTEHDLRTELSRGPLAKNGFDENLRNRINARLEASPLPAKRRILRAGAVCAALLLCAVILLQWAPWKLYIQVADSGRPLIQDGPFPGANTQPEAVQNLPGHTSDVNSAMLIGLRTDVPKENGEPGLRRYRTWLIAPEDGQLKKVTEGDGILMPYEQHFWKIEPRLETGESGRMQTLTAYRADQGVSAVVDSTQMESVSSHAPLFFEEILQFAGNRYVAVTQQVIADPDQPAKALEYNWVKEIEQLVGAERKPELPVNPASEPHLPWEGTVQIRENNGNTTVSLAAADQWTIVRQPGRWVGVPSKPAALEENRTSELPETVVSHDTLAVSWNEIRRVRPDARDAFSSPEQDIVAVVYGENIGFYLLEPDTSGDPKIISKPVLELELDSHESIVMVQWAVGNYVEEWKKKTKKWLE